MGTGSFLGVERPGRGVDHPPLSSAEVKERVELYLYFPSGQNFAPCLCHILSGILYSSKYPAVTTATFMQTDSGEYVYKAGHSLLTCASYEAHHSYSHLHKGYKAGQQSVLIFEYTACISVRGICKFYVSGSSVCIWTTDTSDVSYSDGTMPFVVKCCPVMKRWNCCCCSCDLPTAAVIVGWIYMVRHPILLFFSRNVLLSRRENLISYVRHELIQCYPTNCTMELFVVGKNRSQG